MLYKIDSFIYEWFKDFRLSLDEFKRINKLKWLRKGIVMFLCNVEMRWEYINKWDSQVNKISIKNLLYSIFVFVCTYYYMHQRRSMYIME